MRNSITIILLLLMITECKAQTQIVPLGEGYPKIANGYAKDVNNNFSNYEGTWSCTVNGKTFTVVLQKKIMHYLPNYSPPIYEDFLIGGYSYKDGNVILVNTIDQINNPPINIFEYNLYSLTLVKKFVKPICTDCGNSEMRVAMNLKDPNREIPGLKARLILRRITENGVAKIKANLIRDGFVMTQSGQEPQYHEFTVPFGEYVLTKVN